MQGDAAAPAKAWSYFVPPLVIPVAFLFLVLARVAFTGIPS
jgi:hypothetical protein